MGITRTITTVLLGVSEYSGQEIANNGTVTGSEVDVLGDNTSIADGWLYIMASGSNAGTGTLDFKINNRRTTGEAYSKYAYELSVPLSGTLQRFPMGKRPISRYMNCSALNNNSGDTAHTSVLIELEKIS